MLKAILIAVAGSIAAIWAICAYLFFSPIEQRAVDRRIDTPSPSAASMASAPAPAGSQKDQASLIAPRDMGAPPATPQAGDTRAIPPVGEAPPTAPQGDAGPGIARGANSDEEAKRRALIDGQGRVPAVPEPVALPQPSNSTPQYSSLEGYIFDGDSVVVAPPTAPGGPGSVAEKRRQVRLSTDISKIP